jgi:hypothetical protein
MPENIDENATLLNVIEHDELQRERMRPVSESSSSEESTTPSPPPGRPASGVPHADHGTHTDTDAGRYTTQPLVQPPQSVSKRYLRAGFRYFLKDEPHRLAFEDRGVRIATEHNRPDIAESMVEIAAAKGWRRIRVSGHGDFRREAWLQASLRGIAVTGYDPRPVDQARLDELRQPLMTNRIEPIPETYAGHDPAGGTSQSPAITDRADRAVRGPPTARPVGRHAATGQREALAPAQANAWEGVLLEHGDAPYQHNPGNSASHYVRYRDRGGADHIVWGVDLTRAIGESDARIGDTVRLESLGRRWVTVEVQVLDKAGTVINVEEKEVYRNTWQVDVLARAKVPEATKVQSTREASPPNVETAPSPVGRPPEVPSGAEHSPPGRMSGMSTAERVVHLSVIAEAMRAQGFSDKSVERVQTRAMRMLDTFQALGAGVPAPQVYDVKAPATRGRNRTRSDDAVRTVERTPERTPERNRAASEPPLPRL